MRGGIPVAVMLLLAACGSRNPVTFDGAVADAGAVDAGADASIISNGPPSAEPPGTFTAVTAGCTATVSATYGQTVPLTSNTVTVTVAP